LQFNPKDVDENKEFIELKRSRGYTYEDSVEISPEKLPGYHDKVSFHLSFFISFTIRLVSVWYLVFFG